MSARRTERLLNLVICLLSTRRELTKEQVRAAVPQYDACESDAAFDRMFERDKEDLRDLGIPLVTRSLDTWFEDEVGYRIDRDAYALPPVSFTPAESAVLSLAARVWQQASLAGPAASGLVKLKALGVPADSAPLAALEPRVRTAEPAFEPLYAAARDRAPVTFPYRTARTGQVAQRTVEPWGLASRRGHWYLVGHDHGRGAARVFRLSRIPGPVRRAGRPGAYEVPPEVDVRAMVRGQAGPPAERTARLRVRAGAGAALRLRAVTASAAGAVDAPAAGDAGPRADADVLEVRFSDAERLADEVSGYGAAVVVLDPPDVREAVVRRLRGALAALDGLADADGAGPAGRGSGT